MSYAVFKMKVVALINKVGGIKVRFKSEDGVHYANCSDGTTIIGNNSCLGIWVRWGSGHQARAVL